MNKQIDFELDFELAQKPTISTGPLLNKTLTNLLDIEKNVEDDTNQPIIIKQSFGNSH